MLRLSGVEDDRIQIVVRQIKRWMYAVKQDKDKYVALLHSNYAVADIDMLTQMYSDEEIFKATKESRLWLWKEAVRLQDEAQKNIGGR